MYAQVVEYGPAVVLALSRRQVEQLRDASAHWEKALRLSRSPVLISETPSGASIQCRDVSGFIRVGGMSLDILPKFLDPTLVGSGWRNALWRFLAFALETDSIRVPTSGQVTQAIGLADLLADLFIQSAESSSLLGLPLGYQTHRAISHFASGRIDRQRLGRLAVQDGKVPIQNQRLNRDTEIGRLLKWASLELAQLVEVPERRGRLRAWAGSLGDIPNGRPRTVRDVSTARQFPHLSLAVEISLMLFSQRWGHYGAGELELPGFLWKSETLFEKATLRLVRKGAHRLGMTAQKRAHVLTTEQGSPRTVLTTPDIDVHRAGVTHALLDAKYKVLGGSPSADDLYQVMAGGRIRGLARVALLYPKAGTGLSRRTLTPVGPGNPTEVDLLEVGLLSFENQASVRALTAEVTNWLSSQPTPVKLP